MIWLLLLLQMLAELLGARATGNVILLFTLLVLFKYARDTAAIKKAANEQAEGLSKPAVTVLNITPTHVSRDRAWTFFTMQLKNIGNGPALSVRWKLTVSPVPAADKANAFEGTIVHIEAGREHSRNTQEAPFLGGPASYKVECTYRGLSGAEYTSTAMLDQDGSPQILDFGRGE